MVTHLIKLVHIYVTEMIRLNVYGIKDSKVIQTLQMFEHHRNFLGIQQQNFWQSCELKRTDR